MLAQQFPLLIVLCCYCHVWCTLQWFEDLGAFEREENIPIFVEWAVKAVQLFGSRITYWATFNEPTVRAAYAHALLHKLHLHY